MLLAAALLDDPPTRNGRWESEDMTPTGSGMLSKERGVKPCRRSRRHRIFVAPIHESCP